MIDFIKFADWDTHMYTAGYRNDYVKCKKFPDIFLHRDEEEPEWISAGKQWVYK